MKRARASDDSRSRPKSSGTVKSRRSRQSEPATESQTPENVDVAICEAVRENTEEATGVVTYEAVGENTEEVSVDVAGEPAVSNKPSTTTTTTTTRRKKKAPKKPRASVPSSGAGAARRRPTKNLKQILAAERATAAACKHKRKTYACIDIALPPYRPVNKFSDLTGFEANYVEPFSKLRYSSAGEYAAIRQLPPDIINGYLALRRASNVIL